MSDRSKAVFLSYASQDAEAAARICDALRTAGVEVWFDKSELVGGDAWDAKIRRQIRECAIFVPVISASTQARPEGYFRLEWKLAVDRSHLMADDQAFIVPVVIDDTLQGAARVPDKFQEVQWTRLVMTETPAAFAARVQRLVTGEVTGYLASNAAREDRRDTRASRREKRPRWWLVFPIAGMAVGVYFAVNPAARSNRSPDTKPAAPASPPAPVSKARELGNRAKAMMQNYNSTAEDYAAAENLLKTALELDPNDAELWVTSSLLNFAFGSRGFDRSPTRNTAARSHAERALKLAPDSIDGLFALGRWQRDFDEPAVAEATLKQVLARDPNHAGALQNMGYLYDRLDRFDEAVAAYERAAANPDSAALARYTQFLTYFRRARFPEADRSIRQSVAAQPATNSQAGLAMLLITWKGDVEEAAKVMASGPASIRNEPRVLWVATLVHLARRQPEDALRTLGRLSDEFILDNWFVGPKAYWVGRAHAQAGRTEAARVAWEAGLALTRAKLKDAPADRGVHLVQGELLALLGQRGEALREARLVDELRREKDSWVSSPVRIYAGLGDAEATLPLLRTLRAGLGENLGWPLTLPLLRLDPIWDKIRDHPGFQELLLQPDIAVVASPSAATWPREPELKRAIDLINGTDANLEDYALAEDVVKARLAQSPMDPETITVMARVQVAFLFRGFDRSDERRGVAKRYAERAVQLAPNDPEALAALGIFYFHRNADLARARELLERAISLKPSDPFLHRFRDNALFSDRKVPVTQALASSERTAALFPRDALSQYELARNYRDAGRIAEMEKSLDRAIALAPIANAVMWKSRIALWVRGDPQEMRKLIDSVPSRTRSIERVVLNRWVHAMASNQPGEGLDALENLTSNWIEDFDYTGPKALLAAVLLELHGKRELARLQYETALRDVRHQQARNPADPFLPGLEAWILHGFGRDQDAKAFNRIALEGAMRPYSYTILSDWWFTAIPRCLLIGERSVALELMREAISPGASPAAVRGGAGADAAVESRRVGVESLSPRGLAVAPTPAEARAAFRLRFKFDPRMAPFRNDPEIVTLLAEQPAK